MSAPGATTQAGKASAMVEITFLDGSARSCAAGSTVRDVLKSRLSAKELKNVFAAKRDGVPVDLDAPLTESCRLEPLDFSSAEGKEVYRHSSAHVMAQAVKDVFPAAQLTIGPPIEDGFYYDFAFERPFTPEDLEKIETRALEIIQADLPITRREMSRAEALEFFRKRGELYKAEIIESIPDSIVSLYQQGEFVDLCRGPHIGSTGRIHAFKLLSSAGAYWRGDERNPMLQRIYGTSFDSQEALGAYLTKLEEIKRRDHRKLGKELDLFSVQDETGPGLILWHPKGALIRLLIENFWREHHIKNGYQMVYSPHIARLDLWKTSGHVDYYRDNMFAPMLVENNEYQLKPMNCPFHIMVYKSHLRSYRDLPIRYGELGTVYRYERSGVLHGLLRVRGFTQDDAHIFCRPDQIAEEVSRVLDFTFFVLRRFGFTEFELFLSTRPEKAVGSEEKWVQATQALEAALQTGHIPYTVDPGEGVFYGPKIDLKIKDVLGRSWQCSTVQIDFNNPERFGLTYAGEDGRHHQPIMIHRALMGSIERFFGILIEHYAGAFPTWLAPVQVRVLPITDKQSPYGKSLIDRLQEGGYRAEMDARNEKIGLKIREAEKAKIPYMLVIGEREMESAKVSVRKRSGQNAGAVTIEEFIDLLRQDLLMVEQEVASPSE